MAQGEGRPGLVKPGRLSRRAASTATIAGRRFASARAGGIVSGITGNDDPLETGNVICGNEFVHAELVKIFKPLGT